MKSRLAVIAVTLAVATAVLFPTPSFATTTPPEGGGCGEAVATDKGSDGGLAYSTATVVNNCGVKVRAFAHCYLRGGISEPWAYGSVITSGTSTASCAYGTIYTIGTYGYQTLSGSTWTTHYH